MPSLGPVGFPGVPEPGSARREARRPGKRMGPKKFAEPVSLSSTPPADFPLPRTAARLGFVLLALRARRRQDSTLGSKDTSRGKGTNLAQFAKVPFGSSLGGSDARGGASVARRRQTPRRPPVLENTGRPAAVRPPRVWLSSRTATRRPSRRPQLVSQVSAAIPERGCAELMLREAIVQPEILSGFRDN